MSNLQKLETLCPGDQFCIPGTDLEGTVIEVNSSRVIIKKTVEPTEVAFMDGDKLREFIATSSGLESWAPGTEVEKKVKVIE